MVMDKKYAVVQFGHFNTKIPINQLVVEEDYEEPKQPKRKAGTHTQNLIVEKSQFVSELDIRGKFKEEASHLIEEFIDKALMLNMDKVRIIHGKGNGILRSLVKSILKENGIKKHYFEPYEMGGDGVTIIEF
jgi:DNA mismatch repair protein MutS2